MIIKTGQSLPAMFASCVVTIAAFGSNIAHSLTDEIPPRAAEAIRSLQEHLIRIDDVRFTARLTEETVFGESQKIQFEGTLEVAIKRPASFAADMRSDLANRSFWLHDGIFTVFDEDVNVYAEVPADGTYAEAIQFIAHEYGAAVPMTDLLSGQAYELLVSQATEVVYVGIGNVDDHKCHHIAGRVREVDWQVWIRAEGDPWLCKYIITDRGQPMAPQFSLRFLDWKVATDHPETDFRFTAPKGAEQVEFVRP